MRNYTTKPRSPTIATELSVTTKRVLMAGYIGLILLESNIDTFTFYNNRRQIDRCDNIGLTIADQLT